VLYNCKDFGTTNPDPSKPPKRYYNVAKSQRRLNATMWKSTRTVNTEDYTQAITYYNWEIHDSSDDVGQEEYVGMFYTTYYI